MCHSGQVVRYKSCCTSFNAGSPRTALGDAYVTAVTLYQSGPWSKKLEVWDLISGFMSQARHTFQSLGFLISEEGTGVGKMWPSFPCSVCRFPRVCRRFPHLFNLCAQHLILELLQQERGKRGSRTFCVCSPLIVPSERALLLNPQRVPQHPQDEIQALHTAIQSVPWSNPDLRSNHTFLYTTPHPTLGPKGRSHTSLCTFLLFHPFSFPDMLFPSLIVTCSNLIHL